MWLTSPQFLSQSILHGVKSVVMATPQFECLNGLYSIRNSTNLGVMLLLFFAGPLSGRSAKEQAGWLGPWIVEQGTEIYTTLDWGGGEKEDPIKVLEKLTRYIRPRKNKRIARQAEETRYKWAFRPFCEGFTAAFNGLWICWTRRYANWRHHRGGLWETSARKTTGQRWESDVSQGHNNMRCLRNKWKLSEIILHALKCLL